MRRRLWHDVGASLGYDVVKSVAIWSSPDADRPHRQDFQILVMLWAYLWPVVGVEAGCDYPLDEHIPERR